MPYLLTLFLLMINTLYADDFKRLNSSPTQEMKVHIKNAKLCNSPAIAKENLDNDFKYGCFCGKNYPHLISSTKKSYRDLDRDEKDELISQYYTIKPYDSIDTLCMKHDICYISQGREDQLCNDILYDELKILSSKFYEIAKEKGVDSTAMRCERLASDVGVIFKTIFGSGENLSMMRFGMFMMINTPMTVISKSIQKASHGMNDSPLYPLPDEKCDI